MSDGRDVRSKAYSIYLESTRGTEGEGYCFDAAGALERRKLSRRFAKLRLACKRRVASVRLRGGAYTYLDIEYSRSRSGVTSSTLLQYSRLDYRSGQIPNARHTDDLEQLVRREVLQLDVVGALAGLQCRNGASLDEGTI